MICIAGHIGVGHSFSHSGFIQDDSQGFAVVGYIVRELFKVDTRIEEVNVDTENNIITIRTRGGGIGRSSPRRGITPFEAEILERLRGEDALLPHYLTLKTFGRFYGHGVSEVPSSTEYAIAAAVIDTFAKNIPGFNITAREDDIASDIIGGVRVEVEGIPVVFLLTINGSRIGVGPVEDLEGNVALPPKRELMEKLGVLKAPTIIIESKAYIPSLEVDKEKFLVRYNWEVDNIIVAKSITGSLKELNLEYLEIPSAFPLRKNAMRNSIQELTDRIIALVNKIKITENAVERAKIIAEISKIVSEDIGSIIFMSNRVHDVVRDAGLMPGTAAVLSKVVPAEYLRRYKVVFTTEEDIRIISNIVQKAIRILAENYLEAINEISRKFIDVI